MLPLSPARRITMPDRLERARGSPGFNCRSDARLYPQPDTCTAAREMKNARAAIYVPSANSNRLERSRASSVSGLANCA